MSGFINGIPTSGISDMYIRQQMVGQMQADQTLMNSLETQISTGEQFQLPGQNPGAAQQVIALQSLLQRNSQFQSNVSTNQSYLSQTDATLSQVSSLLSNIQAAAVSVVGSTASDSQRQAVVQQVNQAVEQLVNLGNTQFNGRYLFGGSDTGSPPFTITADGNVQYSGDDSQLSSYSDLNALFTTNVSGAAAFGAVSQPIEGSALSRALTSQTSLADLNQGAGVAPGSIAVSNGTSTSVIDLSQAATIGDVATLIRDHPPAGSALDVEVTPTGLTIQLAAGAGQGQSLSLSEVGLGTTARDLGILSPTGVGTGPLVGSALDPALTATTSLDDLLGTRATGFIHFPGFNNDIVLQAHTPGATAADGTPLNGVQIQFVGDAVAGQETAKYTPGTPAGIGQPAVAGTLTVHIQVGASEPQAIVNAINAATGSPFTARLDPTDSNGGLQQPVTALPTTSATAGGGGSAPDLTGLQVQSGGKTYTIDLSGAKTVQDVLGAINCSGTGLLAQINPQQTGINVSSRTSGADFSIGETGGHTATELGLRTLTDATPLAQLNHGAGVGLSTTGGGDFTVSQDIPAQIQGQPDQVIQFDVSLSGAKTMGDVCRRITAQARAAGCPLRAQLSANGNGIELVANGPAEGAITVTPDTASTAAVDLGLVPAGQSSASSLVTPGGLHSLSGGDVNPQQTQSVFSALIGLSNALQSNASTGQQQAMSVLKNSTQNLSNVRADLGAQEQGLSTISTQLDSQKTQLQSTMSTDYDADMAQVLSEFTAAQTAYQASLEATGAMLKMTLLDYL
jgi:flagellin-like hook-associated protein FlgL